MTEQVEVTPSDAMAAGFNKVRGNTPEEPIAEVVTETPTPDVPDTPEPDPEVIPGYTAKQITERFARMDELASKFEKSRDKTAGTIGELKQVVDELKRTPAGQPIQVTAEQFKDLAEEYGDEMAKRLASGLNGIFVPSPQAPDLTQFDQKLSESQAETQRKVEYAIVYARHDDFEDVIKSEDFGKWRGQLSPTDTERFTKASTSFNGREVSKLVSEFKAWRDKPKETPKPTPSRLEKTVLPKSDGSRAKSGVLPDSAGLSAGFNRVRGR